MSADSERVYTIPLGKVLLSPDNRRAMRAINMIREFARRHMNVEDVRIEEKLSHQVWARGIKKPPRKIKVRMSKTDDGHVLVSPYALAAPEPEPAAKAAEPEAPDTAAASEASDAATAQAAAGGPEPGVREDAPEPGTETAPEPEPEASAGSESDSKADAPKPEPAAAEPETPAPEPDSDEPKSKD